MNDKHILILGESPAVDVAKDIVETVFDSTFVMRFFVSEKVPVGITSYMTAPDTRTD